MLYGNAENAFLSVNLQYRLVFSRLDRSSKQKKSKPKDSILPRRGEKNGKRLLFPPKKSFGQLRKIGRRKDSGEKT